MKYKLLLWILTSIFLLASAFATTNDALLYYSLDNANMSGQNPLDISGNSNDGTGTGLSTGETGVINEAILFNGVNGYFETGYDPTDTYTITGWFYIPTFDSTESIIGVRDSTGSAGTREFFIQHSASNTIFLQYYNSANGVAGDITGTITENAWNYITLTRSGNNIELFVDTSSQGTDSTATKNNPSYEPVVGRLGDQAVQYWDGYVDEFAIYNRVLTTGEIAELYNSGSGFNPYTTSAPTVFFQITSSDIWSTVDLQNINVTLLADNGSNYSYVNSSGNTIYTDIPTNYSGLVDIQTNSSEFFPNHLSNINVSSNIQVNLTQTQVSFNSYQLITNTSIATNVTVNATTLPNTYLFNLTKGNYTVTFNKDGYFSKSAQFNIPALYNGTFNISGLYNNILNITGTGYPGTSTIFYFNSTVDAINFSYSNFSVVTNGSLQLQLINGTYQVYIFPENYTDSITNITLTSGIYNYSFTGFTVNSINFTFRDADTHDIVLSNISLEIVGTFDSRNITVVNGSTYVDLLVPDSYYITYTSAGYETSFYNYQVTPRSTAALTLYLQNSSTATNVTLNLYDEYGQILPDARITVLRHSIISNSYVTDQIVVTNFEGTSTLNLVLDTQFYKFQVEFPIGTVIELTDPTIITSTVINLQVNTGGNVYENFNTISGIPYSLTFNNITNNFKFEWSDTNSIVANACLYVYNTTNYQETLINSSCSTSFTGTLLGHVFSDNGTSYVARAYLDVGNGLTFLTSASKSFGETIPDTKSFLFWDAILTMTIFVMSLSVSVAFAISIIPTVTLIFISLGFLPLNLLGAFIGIQIVFIIIGVGLSYKD